SWEKDYRELVERIFKNIRKNIIWISLGTFRFKPQLKKIIENRFPQNELLDAELVLDFDRKLRYPKPIRIKIYKKMLEFIREYNKDIFVYLCMEESAIWKEVF
ncbi:MAG: DNA photolyase, partial [Candidatus Omnitrophica bacterium]|nr:DNA photolyase [Candidatus Omnitrophota bacterium]